MDRITTLKERNVESLSPVRESVNPQKNQAVLNNLGENADGQLTYKGNVVGATIPTMVEFAFDYETGIIRTDVGNTIVVECALLPNNARVAKVEVPDVLNGSDEMFALEDIIVNDPSQNFATPYIIGYPKNMQGQFFPVAAYVSFPIAPSEIFGAVELGIYTLKPAKLYYIIEEN